MQDVTVMGGKGSQRLERGQLYELARTLANDLMRAGYVTLEPEPEVATMAPAETATAPRPRRRKGEL